MRWSGCPARYRAQIQGAMGLMRLPWCDFVVWTQQKGLTVKRVPSARPNYCSHSWVRVSATTLVNCCLP